MAAIVPSNVNADDHYWVRLAWPTAQHGRLIEDYLKAARSTVTD